VHSNEKEEKKVKENIRKNNNISIAILNKQAE